jgi:hypothetical protein
VTFYHFLVNLYELAMLEVILIFFMIFFILTFFYKQAICEFRINQINWTQKDDIPALLNEKVPIVIRSIPSATFWTRNDVLTRDCFHIPIFKELSLTEWIASSTPDSICPWTHVQAEIIANVSGINIWANKINPFIHPFLKWWIFPRYHCWAGNIGLRKTFSWTCFFPVDGEIILSIMPENVESSLPENWMNCFPANLTTKDTPFVSDLKFIDIILRPGNCIFIPAHWFVSWTTTPTAENTPMVCSISYHTPISLAFTRV